MSLETLHEPSLETTQTPARASLYWLIIAALLAVAALLMQVTNSFANLAFFAASLGMVAGVALVVQNLHKNPAQRRWLIPLTIVVLVGILAASRFTRLQVFLFGKEIAVNGEWIGLSYLVLRLIHVVVDSAKPDRAKTDQKEVVKRASFGEMAAYALFPPSLIAGPIHRIDNFLPQLRRLPRSISPIEVVSNLERIGIGFAKKFVLADFLSLFALNAKVVNNPNVSPLVVWLSLFAFAFRLYFDFAGYSDMAIGVAGLIGIRLPENFANPYAQTNITRFWQSWHMSLSSWLRDYIFVPVSRFLLKRFGAKRTALIMAISHITTMVIAGLWHAFTLPFIVWGLWHGVGLFIHAQWSRMAHQRGWQTIVPSGVGVILTFMFVTIGWVFFALPDLQTSFRCLARLINR